MKSTRLRPARRRRSQTRLRGVVAHGSCTGGIAAGVRSRSRGAEVLLALILLPFHIAAGVRSRSAVAAREKQCAIAQEQAPIGPGRPKNNSDNVTILDDGRGNGASYLLRRLARMVDVGRQRQRARRDPCAAYGGGRVSNVGKWTT
jgi:hypothetical protein